MKSLAELDNNQGILADTLDATQKGFYDGVGGIAETFGAHSLQEWSKKKSDEQVEDMSLAGREALSKQFFERDELGALKVGDAATDLRSWTMNVGHMLGTNADVLIGAGAMKVGRAAVTTVVNRAKSVLKSKGLSDEVASRIASQAGKTYALKNKPWAQNIVDYGVPAHAVHGGMQASDIREEVEAMELDELMAAPVAQEKLAQLKYHYPQYTDEELSGEVRRLVADDAANNALTNPTSIAANMLFGGLQAKVLEKLARGGISKPAAVVYEAASEGFQEGIQQVGSNQVLQTVKPETDLFDNVAESSLTGVALGAGMGSVAAGARAGAEKALDLHSNRGSQPEMQQAQPEVQQAQPEVQQAQPEVQQAQPEMQQAQPEEQKVKDTKLFLNGMKNQVSDLAKAFESAGIQQKNYSKITSYINSQSANRYMKVSTAADETFMYNILNNKVWKRALNGIPDESKDAVSKQMENILRSAVERAKPVATQQPTQQDSPQQQTSSPQAQEWEESNAGLSAQRSKLRSRLISNSKVPIENYTLDEQTAIDAETVDPIATQQALEQFEQSPQSIDDVNQFEARIFEIAADGDATATRVNEHVERSQISKQARKEQVLAQRYQEDNLASARESEKAAERERQERESKQKAENQTQAYLAAEAARKKQAEIDAENAQYRAEAQKISDRRDKSNQVVDEIVAKQKWRETGRKLGNKRFAVESELEARKLRDADYELARQQHEAELAEQARKEQAEAVKAQRRAALENKLEQETVGDKLNQIESSVADKPYVYQTEQLPNNAMSEAFSKQINDAVEYGNGMSKVSVDNNGSIDVEHIEQQQLKRDADYDRAKAQAFIQQGRDNRREALGHQVEGERTGDKLKDGEKRAKFAAMAKALKPKRDALRAKLKAANSRAVDGLGNALINDDQAAMDSFDADYVPSNVFAEAFAEAKANGQDEKAAALSRLEQAKERELSSIKNRAKRVEAKKRIDKALKSWLADDNGDWSMPVIEPTKVENDYLQFDVPNFEPDQAINKEVTGLTTENVDNLSNNDDSLTQADADEQVSLADKIQLSLDDYSDKSLVVRGDTKPVKDRLKGAGFKFNARLKGGAGWVVPKSKQAEAQALVDELNGNAPVENGVDLAKGEDSTVEVKTQQGLSVPAKTTYRDLSDVEKEVQAYAYAGQESVIGRDGKVSKDFLERASEKSFDIEYGANDNQAGNFSLGNSFGWDTSSIALLNDADRNKLINSINSKVLHLGSEMDGLDSVVDDPNEGVVFNDNGLLFFESQMTADDFTGRYGETYAFKMKLKNPLVIDSSEPLMDLSDSPALDYANKNGYDSVVSLDGDVLLLPSYISKGGQLERVHALESDTNGQETDKIASSNESQYLSSTSTGRSFESDSDMDDAMLEADIDASDELLTNNDNQELKAKWKDAGKTKSQPEPPQLIEFIKKNNVSVAYKGHFKGVDPDYFGKFRFGGWWYLPQSAAIQGLSPESVPLGIIRKLYEQDIDSNRFSNKHITFIEELNADNSDNSKELAAQLLQELGGVLKNKRPDPHSPYYTTLFKGPELAIEQFWGSAHRLNTLESKQRDAAAKVISEVYGIELNSKADLDNDAAQHERFKRAADLHGLLWARDKAFLIEAFKDKAQLEEMLKDAGLFVYAPHKDTKREINKLIEWRDTAELRMQEFAERQSAKKKIKQLRQDGQQVDKALYELLDKDAGEFVYRKGDLHLAEVLGLEVVPMVGQAGVHEPAFNSLNSLLEDAHSHLSDLVERLSEDYVGVGLRGAGASTLSNKDYSDLGVSLMRMLKLPNEDSIKALIARPVRKFAKGLLNKDKANYEHPELKQDNEYYYSDAKSGKWHNANKVYNFIRKHKLKNKVVVYKAGNGFDLKKIKSIDKSRLYVIEDSEQAGYQPVLVTDNLEQAQNIADFFTAYHNGMDYRFPVKFKKRDDGKYEIPLVSGEFAVAKLGLKIANGSGSLSDNDLVNAYISNGFEPKEYITNLQDKNNASTTSGGVDSTTQQTTQTDESGVALASAERAGDGQRGTSAGDSANNDGRGRGRDSGQSAGTNSATTGKPSRNKRVKKTDPDKLAGSADSRRSLKDSDTGNADGSPSNEQANTITELGNSFDEKLKAQAAAEGTPYKANDKENIDKSLPFLYPEQRDDILKAENRFFGDGAKGEAGGKGMLFTNGTGTGKTLVGSGVIKRALQRGAKRILVVSPAGVISHWKTDGGYLGIQFHALKNKQDAGIDGVNITSYQNFYDNHHLSGTQWDLVVYDESHKIMGNMGGKATEASNAHRKVTNPHGAGDTHFYYRAARVLDDAWQKYKAEKKAVFEKAKKANPDLLDGAVQALVSKDEKLKKKYAALDKKTTTLGNKLKREEKKNPTKVLFLSATPFATEKSVFYADGYLFDSGSNASDSQAYNTGSGSEQYLVRNFGYRMRYNKANQPGAEVDRSLMERQWSDSMVDAGVMSRRELEVDADYSREFVLTDSYIGNKIDEGYKVLSDNHKRFGHLSRHFSDNMKGGKDRDLLEALRAEESIERIEQHLALGRKVVIFHKRMDMIAQHPFQFKGDKDPMVKAQYDDFAKSYPEFISLPLSGLRSVPDTIVSHFGRDKVALFNGQNKKDRNKEKDDFNADDGKRQIMVVQKDAGKEGLSVHDKTGKFQRALMIMNMPESPADAIQMEGRIFRYMVKTNAVMEYPIIGTSWESYAYRETVSYRTSTAENLAMGSKARNLKDSFREGYLDPVDEAPNNKQGTGSKAIDRQVNEITPFDKAKTYYWARGKKTSKNKSAEGSNYFATPEPVGQKMVEWLRLSAGEKALEPSGGHGAIARWLPENTNNTAVEESRQLIGELGLVTDGDVLHQRFEDLNLVNKYHAIAMNPPFGHGGSEAIPHLEKAFKHLKDGGRIVAILPKGSLADKRFNKFMEELKGGYMVADIDLPSVTFSRAGTTTPTHIVVLDKDLKGKSATPQPRQLDLTHIEDIKELFDEIETMEMRDRPDVSIEAKDASMTERVRERKQLDGGVRKVIEVELDGYEAARNKMRLNKTQLRKLVEKRFGQVEKDVFGDPRYVFEQQEDVQRFYNDVIDEAAKLRAKNNYSLVNKKPRKSLNKPDVERVATEFISKLRGAAAVQYTVVDSQSDLPNPPDDGVAQAEYQDGHVYLVRENIESQKALEAILREEVIAHHGLNKVMNSAGYRKLLDRVIASKDGALKAQWAEVESLYSDFDLDAQAEEVIGKLAQVERSQLGMVWTRIKNLLVSGLRRVGVLPAGKISKAEVQSVLDGIARSMRAGHEPQGPNGGNNKGRALNARVAKSKSDFGAAKLASNISNAAKNFNLKKVPELLKSAWQNNRKHALKFAPRRMITELASTLSAASQSFVDSLRKYDSLVSQMEASRNEMINRAQEVADEWRKIMSQQPAVADQLAELMHDSTLSGVDPSTETYQPAIGVEQAKQMLKLINEKIKGRNGDATFMAQQMNAKKRIESALKKEQDGSREATYNELRARYMALPEGLRGRYVDRQPGKRYEPTARRKGAQVYEPGIFEKARDVYKSQNIRREIALIQRIEDLMSDDKAAASLAAEVRAQFEMNEIDGIYFPLQRFGDYAGMVLDGDGNVDSYSMFESYSDLQEWKKQQRDLMPSDYTVIAEKRVEMTKHLDAVNPRFMNNVVEKLKGFGTEGERVRDEIYQMYLESLPEMSARKHQKHRKGTAGYSNDALRAYAHNTFHGAYDVARIENTHHMETVLDELRFDQQTARNNDNDDSYKMTDIINELQRRHEWIMNPQGSSIANTLTNVGFMWYLGATPAAALLNMTQTPILALPILGAKYGWAQASKELAIASKEFITGKGHSEKRLTGYEKLAFDHFLDSGVIDKTLAHDLSGLAEGGIEYSPKIHKFTEMVSFMFHHTERYNREVTALAAYRMAAKRLKKAGLNAKAVHEKAIEEATEVTYKAHFDYSNANKARFMQSDTAKVLLLFRQHSINMTWRLIRDVQQSIAGSSPAIRSQARKQLAGVLGMTFLFAGAVGLPLFGVVMGMLNMAFDDEDDPFNAEAEFRSFVTEHLGKEASEIIFKGFANAVTGADVSSRTSLNNLWLRDPDPSLEGKAVIQYYAEQALGPIYGIVEGVLGRAPQLWREGHIDRAAEAALPKALRDGLKAIRYHNEGVNSLRGDAVLEDTSIWQEILQASGWTPHQISEIYDQNSAYKGVERRILQRRKRLIARYALGVRLKDADLINKTLAQIAKFNSVNKSVEIKRSQLRQSIYRREQLSKKAQSGVILNEKLRDKQEDLKFI